MIPSRLLPISTRYWPRIVLLLCAGLLFFTAGNLNWHEREWRGIVKADGVGYYAYLPAIMLYQDLSFSYLDQESTFQTREEWDYFRQEVNGKTVNRYFVGTALVQLPFFLLGHLTATLGPAEANGFSFPYYLWVHIGALCWTLWGLYLLIPLLRSFQVRDKHIALILPLILLGTNLFYYAVEEPFMSHLYSFALVNGALLLTRKWFLERSPRWLWGLGLSLGLIVLIRPVNGLILLALPLVVPGGKVSTGWRYLREQPGALFGAILLGLTLVSVQLLIYYLQTGSPWVYSYGPYGFDFRQPHLLDFLFSYRKGFMLYTPLALVGLTGFYYWGKQDSRQALGMAAFLVLIVYIFSSWDFWYYGGGFSARVMIDYLGIWAILFGFLWEGLKGKTIRSSALVLIVLLCLVSQIQTYQYRTGHILWDGMTKELYWDRFLRIDRILFPDQGLSLIQPLR